jgi:hypothetical protein
MLALKPNCEHCNVDLPPNSPDARICTFECTFCATCVDTVLQGVCPNCGGNFVPRPIRPESLLEAYPASTVREHSPVDLEAHERMLTARRANGAVSGSAQSG